MRQELAALVQLPRLGRRAPWSESAEFKAIAEYLTADLDADPFIWGSLLGWWCVHSLGQVAGEASFADRSRSWIDEWLLGKVLAGALQDLGLDEDRAGQAVAVIKVLTSHQRWSLLHPALSAGSVLDAALPAGLVAPASLLAGGEAGYRSDARMRAYVVLEALLKDDEVQHFLRVNRYGDVLWFNKEAFGQLRWWLLVVAAVQIMAVRPAAEGASDILAAYEVIQQLQQAEERSGYQLEELVRLLQSSPAGAGRGTSGETAAPAPVSP
jgi:hypothetical protein